MKILLSIVLILLVQTSFTQKIELGPEIGMNLIQLESEEYGKNFEPGWYGGAAIKYRFTSYFSLQSGIYYSQKRQYYSSADTTTFDFFGFVDSSSIPEGIDLSTYSKTEGRKVQHYFELPLLATYNYKGLNVYYGGYVGFMFASRKRELTTRYTPFTDAIEPSTLSGGNEFIEALFPEPYTETYTESSSVSNLRTVDYGFKAGLSYQIKPVVINAAYQFGFPDYRIDRQESAKQAHRFFQFSLQYYFEIGKQTHANSRL